MEVTVDAVQVYGGYGFIKEYPVEKLMRARRGGLPRSTAPAQRSGCPMPMRLPSLSRNHAASSPLPPLLG